MKHTKLKTCLVLLLGLGLQATQAQTTLYVSEKAGSETAFTLSGVRRILFTDNNMEITKTNAVTQNFVISGLQKLYFIGNASGIEDYKADTNDKLSLYFNHRDGNLQINYTGTLNTNTRLAIFNLQGQIVKSLPMNSSVANVNLSAFQSGIYLCQVRNNLTVITKKFIINK
jgi:hypothetical protein